MLLYRQPIFVFLGCCEKKIDDGDLLKGFMEAPYR